MVHVLPELWFNTGMKKADAIQILGGSISRAAEEFGSSYQAVDKWPELLPPRIADRVTAAFARKCDREKRRNDFWAFLRGTAPKATQFPSPAATAQEATHG